MREFLKGLDLDSELIDTIMAEHGKLVTGFKEQISTLKEESKNLKDEISEIKKVDIEQIKKEQFDLGKAEGSQEVETFKKSIALKEALKNAKAKDTDLLLKLIADDKIKYEEKDGKYEVSGLEEQISEIKKTHEYLFEAEKKEEKPPQRINVGEPHTEPPTNQPTTLVSALKEAYNKN